MCKLELVRWFTGFMKDSTIALHIFCKTSKDACSTVTYITIQSENDVLLVMTKHHVFPNSAALLSIPSKEMIAVFEGVRVAVIAMKSFSLGLHELHMWTDSVTVLNRIINPTIGPTQFIQRELDKLNELKKKLDKYPTITS